MNSKKSKTKNRPKPSKNSQNIQDTKEIETVIKAEETEKSESLTNEDNTPPQDINPTVPVIEEQPVTAPSDAPKKPKRSKTKKKQDTWIEPTAQDDSNINSANDDKKENTMEMDMQESVEIVPVARKKKNKSKKNVDQPTVEVTPQSLETEVKAEEEKNIKTNLESIQKETEDAEQSKASEFLQKEPTSSKKKKKKKHRHDSEKSDINDPCTLAFQKLLESSENVTDQKEAETLLLDNVNITEDTNIPISVAVTGTNQPDDLQDPTKSEASKTKKKNKKGKHNLPQTEAHISAECKPEPIADITDVPKEETVAAENVELPTTTPDLNLKSKAKIVKPVQKKRKTKSESQDDSVLESLEVDSNNKANESNKSINLEKDEKTIETQLLLAQPDKAVDQSDVNFPSEVTPSEESSKNKNDNVASDKTFDLPKIQESQPEKNIIITDIHKDSGNLEFVKVKTGKQKKKRQQNIERVPEIVDSTSPSTSKTSGINVLESEIKHTESDKKTETFFDITHCEMVEESPKHDELESLSIATPDLIQYPRSTSQQHIDDNNNDTVIEEITATDEVKLGIPIYTAAPIIQGSGESPDAKTLSEPATIKVTEVPSPPTNTSNEKNDIKSRIIEVNKDMEDLRRSIERSLAELTGSEVCNSEVDKEFEELFQNQNTDSQLLKLPKDKLESSMTNPSAATISEVQKEDENTIKTEDVVIKTETLDEKKSDQINPIDQSLSAEDDTKKLDVESDTKDNVPICPARNKGKSKSKKKGKKEALSTSSNTTSTQQSDTTNKDTSKSSKSDNSKEKTEQKPESSKEKGKQQSSNPSGDSDANSKQLKLDLSYEPIENFEDALTSSVDDVNKTFEIIVNEATASLRQNNPQINIIAPKEDTEEKDKEKKEKQNPASQPKNLLGKPNIPASSNKSDYKKERNKPPNSIQAKVKIKDSVEIEKANKEFTESQFNSKNKLMKGSNAPATYSYLSNTNEGFIYKYSFRKVFLQSTCHVCKKTLSQRFPCKFCSLVFYCSQKHQDEDWAKHQSLCFAVSTIAHLKEQKHIYSDVQNVTGQDYRVLRMQMILSCEKILKRKLVPWEQEALLYPRLCADTSCRQWKQSQLKDCEGCGQISYCAEHPDHLPLSHQRWCKSYALYQKLVNYQQMKGRLEPILPTKVMEHYKMPDKMNEVLGAIYEEKIDMDDIQYAALTQLASAPLTAAYGYQLYGSQMNSTCANGVSKKATFTIHTVGTDLQFEADGLNKWEVFFLHLRPDIQDLRMVLVGPDLNPSELPLELLGKIKLCDNCRMNKRKVIFHFHHKETYPDYYSSHDFITPDMVCAFNPNIQRSCMYNMKDTWSSTINCILKQKVPFIISSYNIEELERDMSRVKETSRYNFNVVSEAKHNPFCSLRPDRNFITDHEIPLLFRNYCYSLLCGAF